MTVWLRVPLPAAVLLLLIVAGPASAASTPTVGGLVPDPATIQTRASTPVKVTIAIPDPRVITTGVFLQRLNADGTITNLGVMRDDGTNGDAVSGDRIFTLTRTFNEPQTGTIRLRASAAFLGIVRRVVSEVLTVGVGVVVPPAFGATIAGAGNTTLIVAPDSIDVEIVAGIAAASSTAIVAPVGNLPLAAAVNITFESTEVDGALLPPIEPLQVTVPAPAGTAPGQPFIIAQQMLVDAPDGSGLRPGLIATAAASAVGGTIQTQASPLPGIRHGGTYAVVAATGSGFVTGTVTLAGVIQPGVAVSSNTNPLVAVTNDEGEFSLFISGGAFTLTAFHPLRGARGTATGDIVVHNSTVVKNVALIPLDTPVVSRDGLRNAGFERCTESDDDARGHITGSWIFAGNVRAARQFQALSGASIPPTEGKCLAVLSTGTDSTSSTATLRQRFIVPAGVQTLRVDYQFVSEELGDWIGSAFDDVFEARVTTPEGDTVVTRVKITDFFDPVTFRAKTGSFVAVGNCVAGGDDVCGRTGWRTADVDLSRFATIDRPVTVDLELAVSDRGDNLFDTFVLVDNIRFGTVWIDAKIVSGAAADVERVEEDVRQSTEVLSQAGLNVQLRRVLAIADPVVIDVDTTWAPGILPCPNALQIDGRVTAEAARAMLLARSGTPTDLNLYYVRSSTRVFDGVPKVVNLAAYAIGPDEFCNEVTLQRNAGMFQMDRALGRFGVLPHEIGHILIGADPFSSTLEHKVDPSNLMIGSGVSATGVVNRHQSTNIHRPGNLLIVP